MLCSCAYYKLQNTQTLEPTKVTEFYVRKKKIMYLLDNDNLTF